MLRLDNISVKFEEEQILDNFCLDIKRGEHICLWGASGSGKTTILKTITGSILPSNGNIFFKNRLINETNISELRKNIFWIPQNINLPSRNGAELSDLLNIKHPDSIASKLITLGLDSTFLNRNFNEISIGQKQRVVIAIALSQNKEILLLDEPTSALDSESVELMINAILKDNRIMVISASHDHAWAQAHDQIIKLNN
ncbi:MAG: ATP-binding cassette domain-containing protein [Deltaproteobacteria bacterium]